MNPEDLYDKKLVASRYSINVSNALYSSVLGIVKKYVESLFPKQFFKSTYVRNSIFSVTERNRDDDDDRMIIDKPALSILMNYEPQQASFLGDSFLGANMLVMRQAHGQRGTYKRIAWDNEDKIYVTAMEERSKHAFEVVLSLHSEMQAINTYGFLRSQIGIERPFFLNKRIIEVPLPPSLMGSIAAAKGIDITKSGGMQQFGNLMNKVSDGMINYKYHASSGKYLFFYRYFTNLLFKVNSLDSIDKEVSDKSTITSSVRLNIEVEYGNHTNFIAESYQNLTPPDNIGENMLEDSGIGSILHYSFTTPIAEQMPDGKKCILKSELITDINSVIDETNIMDMLSPDLHRYIEDAICKDPTYETIAQKITPMLLRDDKILVEGTDFEIDWKDKKLVILNPYHNYSYRFLLYANITDINNFLVNRYSSDIKTTDIAVNRVTDDDYAAKYDLPSVVRGDSIKRFAIRLKGIIPVAVCCQLRDSFGKLIHEFETEIEPDGRILFARVPKEITTNWKPGMYRHDIEFTLEDGISRTYLKGNLTVLGDDSRCESP